MEMRQSLNILEQILNHLSHVSGPIKTVNNKFVPPYRFELKKSMEAVIDHFKYYTEGYKLKKGETYIGTEAPKG
jgi:NADH-quinone oxidoreductase subunit D